MTLTYLSPDIARCLSHTFDSVRSRDPNVRGADMPALARGRLRSGKMARMILVHFCQAQRLYSCGSGAMDSGRLDLTAVSNHWVEPSRPQTVV